MMRYMKIVLETVSESLIDREDYNGTKLKNTIRIERGCVIHCSF